MLSVLIGAGFLYWATMEEQPHASPPSTTPPQSSSSKTPFDSKHYAWAKEVRVREENLRSLGVTSAPGPTLIAAPAVASPAPDVGRSQWNSAGTFEMREVTGKARPLMEAALLGVAHPLARMGGSVLRVTAVTRNSGTATLAFVRGKVKPGFEWAVAADWSIVAAVDDAGGAGNGAVATAEGGAPVIGGAAIADSSPLEVAHGSLELVDIADGDSDCFDALRIVVKSVVDADSVGAGQANILRVRGVALPIEKGALRAALLGEVELFRDVVRGWSKALAALPTAAAS